MISLVTRLVVVPYLCMLMPPTHRVFLRVSLLLLLLLHIGFGHSLGYTDRPTTQYQVAQEPEPYFTIRFLYVSIAPR